MGEPAGGAGLVPRLLALLPDKPGPIDSLTLGTATVYVREGAKPGPRSGSIVITEAELDAARKGRTVVGRERSPRRRR